MSMRTALLLTTPGGFCTLRKRKTTSSLHLVLTLRPGTSTCRHWESRAQGQHRRSWLSRNHNKGANAQCFFLARARARIDLRKRHEQTFPVPGDVYAAGCLCLAGQITASSSLCRHEKIPDRHPGLPFILGIRPSSRISLLGFGDHFDDRSLHLLRYAG